MSAWLSDVYSWLFEQSGFSWRSWRALNNACRVDGPMPQNWDGEW